MVTMKNLFFLVSGLLTLALIGCNGQTGSSSGSTPIKVVCTTGMVADLVKNVGGPWVTVEQLMGQDVDPHLYQATPGDMRKIIKADLVFYSGLHLEGKMTEVLHAKGQKHSGVAIGEHLPKSQILTTEDGISDPHVWFDVSLWAKGIDIVRDTLISHDAAHVEDYRKQAESYRAELTKLHEYAKERMGTIPKAQRVLITSHDAFQYFGRAYEIEVRGIQGISTDSEASVKDINNLVRFLTERKVKAVFVETSVNQRNMQALVEGCQAAGHKVVLGGELFSDAMGQEGTPQGTYIGMVRHNVDTIVNALR
jgi:manganese/zinc/iron transport system substrate-binding protein